MPTGVRRSARAGQFDPAIRGMAAFVTQTLIDQETLTAVDNQLAGFFVCYTLNWQEGMLLPIKQFLVDRCPVSLWMRRTGLAGVLFFLIKGLLWLIVPAVLVIFGYQS